MMHSPDEGSPGGKKIPVAPEQASRDERTEGIRSSYMDLSHPPERPPGGIVAKQRSGWALGQILCLAGKSIGFGDPAVPEPSPVIQNVGN